jgi:hypothetical protein
MIDHIIPQHIVLSSPISGFPCFSGFAGFQLQKQETKVTDIGKKKEPYRAA